MSICIDKAVIQLYSFCVLLVTCLPLSAPDNGMIVCTGNQFEDTCTITCNLGYELVGSGITACQSDQTWSGTEAMCIEGRCSKHCVIYAAGYFEMCTV